MKPSGSNGRALQWTLQSQSFRGEKGQSVVKSDQRGSHAGGSTWVGSFTRVWMGGGRNSIPGGVKHSFHPQWSFGVSIKKHIVVSAFRLKELISQWRIKTYKLQLNVVTTSIKMYLRSVRMLKTGTYLGLECVNRDGRWWAVWGRFLEEVSVSWNSEFELAMWKVILETNTNVCLRFDQYIDTKVHFQFINR